MAHSNRLRKGRFSEPGRIYLVTVTCWRRQSFFSSWRSGRLVVRAMLAASNHGETLCYVVMPDHLHWVVQVCDSGDLSCAVQKVKSLSTQAVRAAGHRGRVWQRGFHDRAVRKDEDVLAIARYVVANPLRAGLVASLGEYPLWDAVWL